jgi:hypothetical protein
MALLERLQILIDADAKGAIREFDKIGDQADRAAKRAETRFEKVGSKLSSIGAKGFVGGAAVLGGLAKLASMSDEADIQFLKLQNSIKGSDQVFKNGGKGIVELADGLQQVTATDGDALVGAGSVLVGLGLTEDQVKTLLPLVNAFSRKFSVDLPTAAKTVGKALDGNAGALRRYGVDVDATALKTDAFGTVVDSLGKAAGGFARSEGKTFSGSLEILKNNLSDIGETAGKGAASVFAGLAGDVAGALKSVNDFNPAIVTAAGGVAAVAATGVTLAGGIAAGIGKLSELKKSFITTSEAGEKSFTKVGKAAGAIAIVGAVFAAVEAGAQIANSINDIDSKYSDAFDGLRVAIKGTDAQLLEAFGTLVEVEDKSAEFAGLWQGFGAEIDLGNFKADIEEVQKSFDDVLDTFGPQQAQRIIDGLRAQNDALDKSSEQYRTNADFIQKNADKIKLRQDALVKATIAERDQKAATTEAIDKFDKQQATLEGLKKATKDYANNIQILRDQYKAAGDAAAAFAQQIESSTFVDDIASSAGGLRKEVQGLGKDLAALPKNFQTALDPFAKVSEAGQKAIDTVINFGKQSTDYLKTLIESGATDLVPQVAAKLRGQLETALKNAGVPPDQIDDYLGLAGLQPFQIDAALKISNAAEELAKLQSTIELFKGEIEKAPVEVRVQIRDLINDGKVAEAEAIISKLARPRTATVKVDVVPGSGTFGDVFFGGFNPGPAPTPARRAPSDIPDRPQPAGGVRPRRAIGGPVTKSVPYTVNEVGPEMFVPSSNGFVMTASDSKRLVAGVEQMLAGASAGVKVDQINIASTDPRQTAREVVRGLRSATYLMGR